MEDIENITEKQENDSSYTVADEKELMLKNQYSAWVKKMDRVESDEEYFVFKESWNLCTEYMMQVMRYALSEQAKGANHES